MPPSSSLRHTILSHLSAVPMHGYQLRKMAGRNAWLYPIKNTSIYSVLHELARSGMVEFRSELHKGRARKIYSLTDAGRVELESWTSQSPDTDFELSDLVAFKISVQQPDNRAASRKWMRETLDQLRERIHEREDELASSPPDSSFATLAFDYGIEVLRLRARLLEDAIGRADQEHRRVSAAKLESA